MRNSVSRRSISGHRRSSKRLVPALAMTATVIAACVIGVGVAQGGDRVKSPSPLGSVAVKVSTTTPRADDVSSASIAVRPSWGRVKQLRITVMLAAARTARAADTSVASRIIVAPAPARGSEVVQLTWKAPKVAGVRYLYACAAPQPRDGHTAICSRFVTIHVAAGTASPVGVAPIDVGSPGNVTGPVQGGPPASGAPVSGAPGDPGSGGTVTTMLAAPVLSSPSASGVLRPTFTGTAPASQTVTLYASANCSGTAAGTAISTAGGAVSIQLGQDATFGTTSSYSAAVTGTSVGSPCSAPVSYTHLGVIVDATGGDAFAPDAVSISAGTMVRWHGQGGSHTVASSGPQTFTGDPSLNAGDNYDVILGAAGTYGFFCQFHTAEHMMGTITVT